MSNPQIPEWDGTQITDDDRALLSTLCASPAFGLLRKVIAQQIKVELAGLLAARGEDMYRIQGRMLGISMIESLPIIIARQYEEKAAKETAQVNAKEALKKQVEAHRSR